MPRPIRTGPTKADYDAMLLIERHVRNSQDGWARIAGRLFGIRLHCTREAANARLVQLCREGFVEREFPGKAQGGGFRLTDAGEEALVSAAPAGGGR
jgi:hypothetical protein